MKIVLQHLTKKFPARGPVRGRKNREDVIAVNDFDFEIPAQYSHIVGLTSHIYAHIGAGPKFFRPPMSKLMWA